MAFKSKSATNPNVAGMQYHIRMKKGDIPPYVLMPGDPERVAKIASLWEKTKDVAYHREYKTIKGEYEGVKLASMSTGMGSPAMAIGIDELLRIGVDTMIRVGSCGSLQKDMGVGDLVISTGAVRLDGASKDYVIPEYPATAHYEVVQALIEAAEMHKVKYHVGVTASTDTFYVGQGRPAYKKYMPSFKTKIFKDMQRAGVKNFEMEAGVLFTLAGLYGFRAGAVCVVVADRVKNEFKISSAMEKKAALVASEAVKILAKNRSKK